MSRIAEIQQAVLDLSESDYLEFRQWFSELDWEKWDEQIDTDSGHGRLDFLIAEALEAKGRGALKEI